MDNDILTESKEDLDLSKIFVSMFADQVNSQDINAVLISQEHV